VPQAVGAIRTQERQYCRLGVGLLLFMGVGRSSTMGREGRQLLLPYPPPPETLLSPILFSEP
jgi:hypothetical protein